MKITSKKPHFINLGVAKIQKISVFAPMNKYGLLFQRILDIVINREEIEQCILYFKTECII